MDTPSISTSRMLDLRAVAFALGTTRRLLACLVLVAFAAAAHWFAESSLSLQTLILAAIAGIAIAMSALLIVQATHVDPISAAVETASLPLAIAVAAGLAIAGQHADFTILEPIGLLLVGSVIFAFNASSASIMRLHPYPVAAILFALAGLITLTNPGDRLIRSDSDGVSLAVFVIGMCGALAVASERWRVVSLGFAVVAAWALSADDGLPEWLVLTVLAAVLLALTTTDPLPVSRLAPSSVELSLCILAAAALFAVCLTQLEDPERAFLLSAVAFLGLLALAGQRALLQRREVQYARLAAINSTIEELARLDHLTALPNRAALESRLIEEVERSVRYRQPFSVLFLDIDRFKQINDELGHAAGDRVLQDLATVLSATIRTPDFAARYGGEEFVILAPGTWTADAQNLGGRIQSAIATQIEGPLGKPITVSIGIAGVPEHGVEPASVLAFADQALYIAKRAGRNRVEIAVGDPSGPA